MPTFDAVIAPSFAQFMLSSSPIPLQIVSLCMVDDAIEFGGPSVQKYIPSALQTFTNNLSAEDLVLRQCSMYGIAQIARVAPSILGGILTTVLPVLSRILSDPEAKSDDNIGVTENALFTIGSIVCLPAYRSMGLDLPNMCSSWLAHMPLRSDETQAKISSHQLCELVEAGDNVILGDGFRNLSAVLRVFAECLMSWQEYEAKKAIDSEVYPLALPATLERIQNVVNNLAQKVDPAVLSPAFAALDAQHQSILQACQSN